MRKLATSLLVVCGLALASQLFAATTLEMGNAAPPLKIAKWVKGTPVSKFQKGKVYVVEFWATWCGPCKSSIPHLTELAKQYKGKATFIGVDCGEVGQGVTYDKATETVKKFVDEMGEKMDYNIGMDDEKGTMSHTWMAASGSNGIPNAFIVGKNGKIWWIGHPMQMEDALKQAVSGKYDAKAIEAANVERRKAAALMQAQREIFAKIKEYQDKGDNKGLVAELDAMFVKTPDLEQVYASFKYTTMAKYDPAGASAYARKLADGVYKEDPQQTASLAAGIVRTNATAEKPDVDTALYIAEKAGKLCDYKLPALLETLGTAYAQKGDYAKAAEYQQKFVDALNAIQGLTDEQKKPALDKLDEYKGKAKG